jgi:phage terminase large subunit-like protein
MTLLLPDEADLAALGMLGRRLDEEPRDPRIEWRATARPEQLLPPGPWRIFYLQGGRGSGKRAPGLRG